MAKNNKNSKRGLGRGLDSLIPKIEDSEEKNNSSITLEDILSSSEDEEIETIENDKENVGKSVEESDKENKEENKEKTKELEKEISEVEKEIEKREDNAKELTEELISEKLIENQIKKSKKNKIENTSNDLITTDTVEEDNAIKISETVENKDDETPKEEIKEEIVLSDYELTSIKEVKEIIEKNPRITLWSAKSSAVFRYLRKTRPEFSISKEASELIDEAVSKRYPEIWELFEDL